MAFWVLVVWAVCDTCSHEPYVRGIYTTAEACLADAEHTQNISNLTGHQQVKCFKPIMQPMPSEVKELAIKSLKAMGAEQ
jgi:glycyl-tRNA synthetase alpha subunit